MRFSILFTSFLFLTQTAFAAGNPASVPIQFEGKQYNLIINKNALFTADGAQSIKGELDKSVGGYSQWTFYLKEDHGFSVIINTKTDKILHQKNTLEANGPYLITASPDNKFVVFDYGTGATERDFDVRTDDGKVIFKNTYLHVLKWGKNGLVYDHPTSVPFNLNKQTKACESMGAAWQLQMYRFDGKDNVSLDTAPEIGCSN